MLEVKHISKRFGEHQVLADVSLKVNQGDVVVILGPSGSGKTTFLRCLNHLEKADGGQLTLSGKDYDLAKLSKKEILEIRRKTAFVFQHYNLFANKTALENILEGLVIARKIPREEAPGKSYKGFISLDKILLIKAMVPNSEKSPETAPANTATAIRYKQILISKSKRPMTVKITLISIRPPVFMRS